MSSNEIPLKYIIKLSGEGWTHSEVPDVICWSFNKFKTSYCTE